MRSTLLSLFALALSACNLNSDLDAIERAPANGVDVTLWEYDAVSLPMGVVPSWVSRVYVEVRSCVYEDQGTGSGDLVVQTGSDSKRIYPNPCDSLDSRDRFWLESHAPHEAWMEADPMWDDEGTTIWASFEVLGW